MAITANYEARSLPVSLREAKSVDGLLVMGQREGWLLKRWSAPGAARISHV